MLSELVNHVWQSTLMAAAIAALAAMLRNDGAHSRYWLWWAASVKFLVPFSLLTALGAALKDAGAPSIELVDWPPTFVALAEPMAEAAGWTRLGTALLAVWAVGFAAVAGTWLVRALKVRALLSASLPYAGALPRNVGRLEARSSQALLEPALVGILRPVLLLPPGIAEHLTRTQLDAVLEHELSHWRRRDNLTAAVHMVVEAVFWFHPLVWWIGARLVEERERACDETVVRAGHDGRAYAEAILNVCERYVASALKCAAGISGADLKRRVVEIARNRVMSDLPIPKKIFVGAFALCTLLAPIIFGAAAQDDRSFIPLVRTAPAYPSEALAAQREGFVNLGFTIDIVGRTKDIVVVESSSPEFEAPAVAALMSWRYRPVLENDEPVERRGVRTIIRFQLAADVGSQDEAE